MKINVTAQNLAFNVADNEGKPLITYSTADYKFSVDIAGLVGAVQTLIAQVEGHDAKAPDEAEEAGVLMGEGSSIVEALADALSKMPKH